MVMCPSCDRENPGGFRHCGHCGALLEAPTPERRKLATLVFCDLSGSTALGERRDSEAVRSLMLSYFREMRDVLERHGGTVEKFVGDAVLAVFGVPAAHEDDALRACRAALEMQGRMAALADAFERTSGVRVAARIGVNTGEVVAGDSSTRETFVTGDAVNVAARLEQAAAPGEVLLGEATLRLVREAVRTEPVPALAAKGKAEPVPAHRLLSIGRGAGRRRDRTVFTGREDELALLERAFALTCDGRPALCTFVGEPGVGKTRLVGEFVARVGARARVARGACLSYGEGITYWPVIEIVRDLAGIGEHETPAQAVERIEAVLAADPRAAPSAALIAQLLGLVDGAASVGETAAAVRDLLAAGARDRPLVVVVDDIQWGEPTLLELLAGLPEALAETPVLLVCLARPELLDTRPDWPLPAVLEPLDFRAMDALLAALLGDTPPLLRAHLAAASGGNPLFTEELVAMLVDDGVVRLEEGGCALTGDLDAVEVPPSLHALLGARLDRLPPRARAALERGAIEGEVFHVDAVVELSAPEERAGVDATIEELAAKDFLRPAEGRFAGGRATRFKHLLVRDTAYRQTTKELRARLHEAFADWLERLVGERLPEVEEILGYHLEQSHRYRVELGAADEPLAVRAAGHLARAGRRAARRGDIDAAAGLLGRAAALLPRAHAARARIAVHLGEALVDAGRTAEASAVFAELDRAGYPDEATRAVATVCRGELDLQTTPTVAVVERVHREAAAAGALLAARGDEQGLLRASWVSYLTSMIAGRSTDARAAIETLGTLAGRLSHPLAGRLPGMRAMNLAWGDTPVPDALVEVCELLQTARDDPAAEPLVLGAYGYLLAQAGEIGAARGALARMRTIAESHGQRVVLWASWGQNVGRAELLAGDPARAEAALRPSYEALRDAGDRGFSSTLAAQLAHALLAQGRAEEALELAAAAREAAGETDVLSQILWRTARATALAARVAGAEALGLAEEAVRLADATEWPNVRADALLDLARVLAATGGDPALVAARAHLIYVAKGNVAGRDRAAPLATTGGRTTTKEGAT